MSKVPMVPEESKSQQALLEAFALAQGEGDADSYSLLDVTSSPSHTASTEKLTELLCEYKATITSATLFKPLDGRTQIQHAGRCALVSNSGVLLKHSYGDEIDAADLVIRFNDAEVGGSVRANVGSRDDVRVLNRKLGNAIATGDFNLTDRTTYMLIRHREDEVAQVLHWLNTTHALAHDGQIMVGTGKAEEIATKILTSPPFDVAIKMLPAGAKNGNPSTGFVGLMLAMSLCDEVHAYGFASTREARHSPFHYYGSLKEVVGGQQLIHAGDHPLASVEKKVFAKLDDADAKQADKTVVPGYSQLEFC